MNPDNEKSGSRADRELMLAAAAIIMLYSLWVGARGLNAAMAISAFLSLALIVFANLEKIVSLKASAQGKAGTPARKSDEEARPAPAGETKDDIKELRELAIIVSKIQISLLARQGWMSGYKEEAQQVLREEMLSVLDKLGVSKEAKDDVIAEVRRFALYDYVLLILGQHQMPRELVLMPDGPQEWHGLRSQALDAPPTAERLTQFLEKYSLLTDERKELLKDYEFYRENNKHRRPYAWNQMSGLGLARHLLNTWPNPPVARQPQTNAPFPKPGIEKGAA